MPFFPIQTQLHAWLLEMLQNKTSPVQIPHLISCYFLGCTNLGAFVSSALPLDSSYPHSPCLSSHAKNKLVEEERGNLREGRLERIKRLRQGLEVS